MVFLGMKDERSGDFSTVNENEVVVVGCNGGVREDGNGRDDKLGGMNTSVLMRSVVCDKIVELKGNGNMWVDRASNDGDTGNVDEWNSQAFLVGDLVWGKIKNQPWLPGLIYDPADASDMASRFRRENSLLVGYFGDGSCSWLSPSQLVPFVEHYEEMSKQSSSNSFVKAVKEALKELGRRVELKMICSCVSEGNLSDLARPEAMNAAVRPGILVPNGAIDKVPSPWCEPAELLSYVRNVGLAGSSNLLEVVLMKSWLASFSRVKRGRSLFIYREPQPIEGLEDKIENAILDTTCFSVPIQGPSEEHSGSPKTLRVMGEDNAELKGKKKVKKPAKTPSTISRNMEAGTHNDIKESGIRQASTAGRMTGRKKIDNSDPHAIVVHDGFQIDRVDNESTQPTMLKKDEDPVHYNGEGSDESTLKRDISRKRKTSRYLCEPYISPLPRLWRPYFKREPETKFDKLVKSANGGDRLTKGAEQLIYSPSLTKSNSAVSEEGMSVANSQNFNEISPNKVVKEVLSAAADVSSMERSSIEPLREFMSAFRNAAYLNTCNNQLYQENSSKKRKVSVHEPLVMVTDLNNPADVPPQPAADSAKINKPRSRVTKLKKAARASQVVDIVLKDIVNLKLMLNNCDGTITVEEKSNLECEIRSMLQKVIDLEVKPSS